MNRSVIAVMLVCLIGRISAQSWIYPQNNWGPAPFSTGFGTGFGTGYGVPTYYANGGHGSGGFNRFGSSSFGRGGGNSLLRTLTLVMLLPNLLGSSGAIPGSTVIGGGTIPGGGIGGSTILGGGTIG